MGKLSASFAPSPSFSVRVYAGILSFVCAEALSGSSLLWAFKPFNYFITFPLYLLHILFFYSLAYHLKKDKLPDLYLFGILFGLYESWVTKVLWAGYPNEDHFILGSFLGHGIHETSVLLFYFHPFISFIFPLVLIGSIFPETSDEIKIQNAFYGDRFLSKILFWFTFIVLSLGPSQHFTHPAHPFLHWIPTLILIYAGYRWVQNSIKNSEEQTSIQLALSVRGTFICGLLILIQYALTYTTLLPEKTPVLLVQGITVLLYMICITAIFRLPSLKNKENRDVHLPTAQQFFRYLIYLSILTAFISMIRIFFPLTILGLATIGFLLMMIMGFILLWRLTLRRFIKNTALRKTDKLCS